jgi:hypothetical protein
MSSAKAKFPGRPVKNNGKLKVKLKTKMPAKNKAELAAKKSLKKRPNVSSASIDKPSNELNEVMEMANKMQHLYDTLINYTDPVRDIIGPFMTKPCKKTYPEYYKVVKNPIDMETINKRIKTKFYKSLDNFAGDIKLMFENCKLYNDPASILYQDACDLLKIFNKEWETTIELTEKMKHLYDTLMNHKNADGFPLIGPFLRRPCEKTYPDYYKEIKYPMDMETIDKRIKTNFYKTMDDFSEDVNLMFENCKLYNRPTSKLFIDAQKLQRIFKNEFTKCIENLPLHPEEEELPLLFLHEVS